MRAGAGHQGLDLDPDPPLRRLRAGGRRGADPAEIADRAFVAAEEWVQILRSSPAVGARPEPAVWSPLEYGCHVRDVYVLFDERLELMLAEDEPTFANWDQDETAVAAAVRRVRSRAGGRGARAAAQSFVARLAAR